MQTYHINGIQVVVTPTTPELQTITFSTVCLDFVTFHWIIEELAAEYNVPTNTCFKWKPELSPENRLWLKFLLSKHINVAVVEQLITQWTTAEYPTLDNYNWKIMALLGGERQYPVTPMKVIAAVSSTTVTTDLIIKLARISQKIANGRSDTVLSVSGICNFGSSFVATLKSDEKNAFLKLNFYSGIPVRKTTFTLLGALNKVTGVTWQAAPDNQNGSFQFKSSKIVVLSEQDLRSVLAYGLPGPVLVKDSSGNLTSAVPSISGTIAGLGADFAGTRDSNEPSSDACKPKPKKALLYFIDETANGIALYLSGLDNPIIGNNVVKKLVSRFSADERLTISDCKIGNTYKIEALYGPFLVSQHVINTLKERALAHLSHYIRDFAWLVFDAKLSYLRHSCQPTAYKSLREGDLNVTFHQPSSLLSVEIENDLFFYFTEQDLKKEIVKHGMEHQIFIGGGADPLTVRFGETSRRYYFVMFNVNDHERVKGDTARDYVLKLNTHLQNVIEKAISDNKL